MFQIHNASNDVFSIRSILGTDDEYASNVRIICFTGPPNKLNFPYDQWIEALTLLDSNTVSKQDIDAITGEPGTKGEILPQFLIDTLNGSLSSERETRWLETIRASMTPSSESSGTLFAVGGEHIPHLCDYLTQAGNTITKLDLSDKSSEHHNS